MNYKKDSLKSWIVLLCGWSFYLYEYVLRVSPSVITNQLMFDFDVTSSTLGILVSSYYFAYVVLQIPCGVIVDKLGVRKIIAVSALFCIVGSFIFARCDSLVMAQIGRFLIGAGSACGYLSCAKIGAEWFDKKHFPIITASTMMMGMLGGVFGGRPFAILANNYQWRNAILLMSFIGICIALLTWFTIPEKYPTSNYQKEKKEPLLKSLKIIMQNPQNWLIGIYSSMMYLVLSAIAELWGVPFIMQLYSINNEQAALGGTMIFLGHGLGCVFSAWLSNLFKTRVKIMNWSALLTLIFFGIIFYVPYIPFSLMLLVFFVGGLFSGGQVLYFAAAKEISPSHSSGTAIGFTNFFVMISGAIFQPLLGVLLDFVWDGSVSAQGTPEYSVFTYQIAFIAVMIGFFISWVTSFFIKETFPKKVHVS
ncbi:MAG: MFS transporter [Alphaproteobacteria bacterium]